MSGNISKNSSLNPTLIDCFCGAGGLSLGFKMAGFRSLYAFDWNKACIDTYNKNLGERGFVKDITKLNRKAIEKKVGKILDNIDVIAGGPPCQGFSIQRRGSDDDIRNNLVPEYIRLVMEFKPRFFLMENVGGLLSKRGAPFLELVKKRCSKEGYFLHIAKLNALDYGLPQDRRRVFLVGEKMEATFLKFEFPKPSHNRVNTVRKAIYDLIKKDEKKVPNHISDKLTAINIRRIRALKEGQSRDSLPKDLQLDCHKNNLSHRHMDVYGRMWWDRPSPTITARFDSFSRGRFGHPSLDRTITLREGARLQTFPDNFVFYGTKVQVATQIGNAVPPLLAKIIAAQIAKALSSHTNVKSEIQLASSAA
ncbi:MAG: DNA cytosine methyltransferase [Bacteroidetes bacterium]|nr:DNA cytosine methyltransferase [Bacteroidota bacterium]